MNEKQYIDLKQLEKNKTLIFKKGITSLNNFDLRDLMDDFISNRNMEIIKIDFSDLEKIEGYFYIGPTNVIELDFKNIKYIGSSLIIRDNKKLEKIIFNRITIDKDCDLRKNDLFSNVDISGIKQVNGNLLLSKKMRSLEYGNLNLSGNVIIGNDINEVITNKIKGTLGE